MLPAVGVSAHTGPLKGTLSTKAEAAKIAGLGRWPRVLVAKTWGPGYEPQNSRTKAHVLANVYNPSTGGWGYLGLSEHQANERPYF